VPAFLAVMRPFELTVATEVLLDAHVICCDDVVGIACAVTCVLSPMKRDKELELTEMLFGRLGSVTVTLTDDLTVEA